MCSTRTSRRARRAVETWSAPRWTEQRLCATVARPRFDIRRAGAGIGSDSRIEPLPLLEDAGVLRIALLAPVA